MLRTPILPYPYYQRSRAQQSHLGHQNHLCYLVTYITLNELKHLVRNPKFICNKCGRAAEHKENLCEPILL